MPELMQCERCRNYSFRTCSCGWHDVGQLEDGQTEPDDTRRLAAKSPEDAAQLWAQMSDAESVEYRIAAGTDQPVLWVADPRGEVTLWDVQGEAVPTYYATEHKPKPARR